METKADAAMSAAAFRLLMVMMVDLLADLLLPPPT
jgi:hypothetical protein